MWGSLKSQKDEVSIKECVTFLKRVTKSLCWHPNHSVNVARIIFGKGTQLHVLPSKCISCDFLILTPTELKVLLILGLNSLLGSKTCGQCLNPEPFRSHGVRVLGPSAA